MGVDRRAHDGHVWVGRGDRLVEFGCPLRVADECFHVLRRGPRVAHTDKLHDAAIGKLSHVGEMPSALAVEAGEGDARRFGPVRRRRAPSR